MAEGAEATARCPITPPPEFKALEEVRLLNRRSVALLRSELSYPLETAESLFLSVTRFSHNNDSSQRGR
jgi:hypothetical protein